MARCARVRNLVLIGHLWADESEGVRMDQSVGWTFRLDLRHVACHTLASARPGLVMRVLLEGGRAWTVRGLGAVAIQAESVRRLD